MKGSTFRVLLALATALALVLGSMSGVSAGIDGGGGGSVEVGGNGNSNNQNGEQGQGQDQGQAQDVEQSTDNGLGQGSDNDAAAGSAVDNDCDASQDDEDDEGDDAVACESGDSSAGDASVGDTNQANTGSQSGTGTSGQNGTQTGGNQANAPSNTTDQTVDADVTDIGGDDNDLIDGSINDNEGSIDQSDDEGVIEGDDNSIGGADALLTFLLDLLTAIFGGGDVVAPGPPPVIQACNQLTTSGGQGTTNTIHQLGVSGPTSFQLQYEMYTVPDQLQVFYGGAIIFDTGGLVSDGSTVTVNVPSGSATTVTVTVSAPLDGTVWDYTVFCPTN